MKLVKRIICAMVGHKPNEGADWIYVRRGSRFEKTLHRVDYCVRCGALVAVSGWRRKKYV